MGSETFRLRSYRDAEDSSHSGSLINSSFNGIL
jgi:hypothetical protein